MSFDQFLLSADTTDLNYPEIRPTLDLNFARVKALDPRITFTRASGGTYVGADGLIKYSGVNEARFDHDPETGESLGLLVEESRTNLALQSEDFSTSWISTFFVVTTNATTAPNGTATADKVARDRVNTAAQISLNATVTVSTAYNFSCFVKAAELSKIGLREGVSTGRFVTFDLTTASIISSSGATTGDITPYPNGWYRVSMQMTTTNVQTGYGMRIVPLRDDYMSGTPFYSFVGDGTSGIYIWGAQLEEGAFPTSYIPTQASTRTRATESVAITGKNFSDFYNQNEGTIFSTTKSILSTENNGFIWFMDNTSTDTEERTELFRVSTNYRVRMRPSSGIDTIFRNIVFSDQDLNNFNNCIVSYKKDDSTAFSNAISTFIVSRGEIPILNRLRFSSSGPQVKWISVFRYWPKRIPNIQIRLLTSK